MMATLRTVRHLVRTDTRSLVWFVSAWCALLVVQAALIGYGAGKWPTMPQGVPYQPEVVLILVKGLMTVVLAAMVVQRDPAVGSAAFWRTRPIGWVTMWGGKVSWIAAWVVLAPALVGALLMALLGIGFSDAWWTAWLVVVEQLFFVGLALMAAALTETFAHLLIAGLAGLAVYVAVMTVVTRWLDVMLPEFELTAPLTPQTLLALLFAAVGVVILAVAYAGRRIVALALLAGGVMAATILMSSVRHPSFPFTQPVRNAPFAGADTIRLAVPPESMRASPGGLIRSDAGWSSGARMYVSGSIDVSGAAPEVMFTVVGVRSTVHLANGSSVRWQSSRVGGTSVGGPALRDSAPYRSTRVALGDPDLAIPPSARNITPSLTLTEMPKASYDSAVKDSATMNAEISLRAYRVAIENRLPLRDGARVRAQRSAWTLIGVERRRGSVFVTLRGATVDQWYRYRGGIGGEVVLHSPQRHQAVSSTHTTRASSWLTMGFAFERAGTETRTDEFVPGDGPGARFTIDDQWLAGAELVFLGTEELGTFTKTVRLEGITLKQ